MRWSLLIGRVKGTEIRVHLTFLLLLALIAAVAGADGGGTAALGAVGFILLLFGSVVLHELGHVAAARWYGIRTPDIILLPIGGVARLERMPREPRQELVIALAGPAVTLAIAAVAYLLLALAGLSSAGVDPPIGSVVRRLLTVNLILLGFNLLPAFPMDGGRVLRALLAMRMDYVRATRLAARVGQLFAIVFAAAGLFTNPFLLLIAAFVYLGARQEALAAEMQEAIAGLSVASAMVTEFRTLPAAATLGEAADLLLRTVQRDYPVVDDEGRVRGVLTRNRLIDALGRLGPGVGVERVMAIDDRALAAESALEDASREMQGSAATLIPVTDADGRLVGILTGETIAEMVMVRGALARLPRADDPAPTAEG